MSTAATTSTLASELRVGVMRLRRRLVSERTADDDLSLRALAVLGVLARRGELTVGQLADFEKVKPPSMTRTIDWLAEAGLVTRRRDVHDKRVVVVELTDTGERTAREERRRRDDWLARRLRDLDPDELAVLRQAAPILERLATAD